MPVIKEKQEKPRYYSLEEKELTEDGNNDTTEA